MRPRPPTASGEAGGRQMTWTSAGHPAPLLDEHGAMVFPGLSTRPRTDHRQHLRPGSVLLPVTDGVVERPGQGMDQAIKEAGRTPAAHHGLGLPRILDGIAGRSLETTPGHDIALLALRPPLAQLAVS
nr:SpoIIE family protein phosphatase [Streptomyces bauhiniae]